MPDLIDIPRATQSSTLATLNASTPTYLASLIAAASQLIRKACHRDFSQTAYAEYQSGGNYVNAALLLRQYPVLSITRVAADPTQVLTVQNTSAANQRATVATTSTGLTLYRMASGVATTDTSVTWAANATVSAVASAVNALGNGWLATAQGGFGLFPSVDLNPLQGALSALSGGASLEMHIEDIQGWSGGYGMNGAYGIYGWRLDADTGELYGVFPRGQQNIRIDYTAGYATVPQPVQEACVQLVQWLYQQGQTNSAVKSAKLGNTSVENSEKRYLPPGVMQLLNPYVAHDRIINR
jgi:hypothetical protein